MADVFVSYATEDRERVAPLVEAFKRQGWSVWWDRGIGPGQKFDEVIERELESARCAVVVWTQNSVVGSDWVRSEALGAMEREILVPVRLDDVRPPIAFRRVQASDLLGWPDHHDGAQYSALIGSVASLVGATPHTNPEPVLDRPSIAVLPFTNMLSDPDGEFIAEGMTEDLITALANSYDMFVIARHSSFTYKSRAVDVRRVGRELGVSYVLVGSVRRFKEGMLRITAQLIETATGTHLWAQKFDRPADKVFELQDELITEVGSATNARILEREVERPARIVEPRAIALWRMNQRFGRANVRQGEATVVGYRTAVAEIDAAIESAPDNALLLAHKAHITAAQTSNFGVENLDEVTNEACALAREALRRAPEDNDVRTLAGFAFVYCGRYEEGIPFLERARRRDPNSMWAAQYLGYGLIMSRTDVARGVELMNEVLRRDPLGPLRSGCLFCEGLAYAEQRDFDSAVSRLRDSIRLQPLFPWAWLLLALYLPGLDRREEARAALDEVRRLFPALTVDAVVSTIRHISSPRAAAGAERILRPLWQESAGA
jgi:TolB-like protein